MGGIDRWNRRETRKFSPICSGIGRVFLIRGNVGLIEGAKEASRMKFDALCKAV